MLCILCKAIGYAARLVLFCALAAGIAPAQATVNYLVITTTPAGSNYPTAFQLSIATSCPSGDAIHYYGLDDLASAYVFNDTFYIYGNGALQNTPGALSTCVAGVPSSLNISSAFSSVANCSNTATNAVSLTAANSPQNLVFCANTALFGTGSNTFNTARITLPDGFTIAIGTRWYGTYLIALRGLTTGPPISVYGWANGGVYGLLPMGPALTQSTAVLAGSSLYGSGSLGSYTVALNTWTALNQTFAYLVGF